jgi:hypothetical protein
MKCLASLPLMLDVCKVLTNMGTCHMVVSCPRRWPGFMLTVWLRHIVLVMFA